MFMDNGFDFFFLLVSATKSNYFNPYKLSVYIDYESKFGAIANYKREICYQCFINYVHSCALLLVAGMMSLYKVILDVYCLLHRK